MFPLVFPYRKPLGHAANNGLLLSPCSPDVSISDITRHMLHSQLIHPDVRQGSGLVCPP